ncbi:DNA alkylation repair enzyme [Thraustotheca clavata]|uniref:DNA alkylation repair enzyme n=1 Tax=Thraustotheca clavata TaxID=74557 RepID=A0A1W0A5K3_9STRA|nr:DNA alkylation repair enzyme [Thraustotheca clavata]
MKRTSTRVSKRLEKTKEVNAVTSIVDSLIKVSSSSYATKVERFFLRSYCPKDIFVGIRVPTCRKIMQEYLETTSEKEVLELVKDDRHEMRLTGLLALAEIYQNPAKAPLWLDKLKDKDKVRLHVCELYLQHTKYCNNWDLVDCSCHKILGDALLRFHRDAMPVYSESQELTSLPNWYQNLLVSLDLWETRISIVLLLYIKAEDVNFALAICHYHISRFFESPELRCTLENEPFESLDLIHKALGWVLRECGKQDRAKLLEFLDNNASKAAKTTIRYATEHLPKTKAKSYISQAN